MSPVERAIQAIRRELWDDWYWLWEVVATVENETGMEQPVELTIAAVRTLLTRGGLTVAHARFTDDGRGSRPDYAEISGEEARSLLDEPGHWRYGSPTSLNFALTVIPDNQR
jgi:hypothetical protein